MRQRLFVHQRHVAAVLTFQMPLVRGEQGAQLGVLPGRLERSRFQVVRLHACHPQIAHRGPQRQRHRRLVRKSTKVAVRLGQIEQQPHHERRTQARFGRIDAALDEERCAHAERDVERRHEAEVEPVGAFARDPLAERASERVRRHENPFRAGTVFGAETSELGDEWIHATSRHRPCEPTEPTASGLPVAGFKTLHVEDRFRNARTPHQRL